MSVYQYFSGNDLTVQQNIVLQSQLKLTLVWIKAYDMVESVNTKILKKKLHHDMKLIKVERGH